MRLGLGVRYRGEACDSLNPPASGKEPVQEPAVILPVQPQPLAGLVLNPPVIPVRGPVRVPFAPFGGDAFRAVSKAHGAAGTMAFQGAWRGLRASAVSLSASTGSGLR